MTQGAAGQPGRILYVEDEADIQTIVVTVLEAIGGFTVVACSSGPQAIAAAPTANADLILLDVMMPGLDGPATLAALRAIPQTAATPVIFMTAKAQASEISEFKRLGALDVITKPFDAMALPEQIGEIWRRSMGASAPAGAQSLPPASASTQAELQALQKKYAAELTANIARLEALCSQIASGADPTAARTLHRGLHSLSGSGETFGYKALSERAKSLELAMSPHLNLTSLPPDVLEHLSSGIAGLYDAARAPDHP